MAPTSIARLPPVTTGTGKSAESRGLEAAW
jgi:hypothetical protein